MPTRTEGETGTAASLENIPGNKIQEKQISNAF